MYSVYAHVNTQDCWEVSLRWRLRAWLILESILCTQLSQVCRYHSKVPIYLHTCIMYLNCQRFLQFIPWQKCAKPSVKESKHWGAKAIQFILQLKIVSRVKVRSSTKQLISGTWRTIQQKSSSSLFCGMSSLQQCKGHSFYDIIQPACPVLEAVLLTLRDALKDHFGKTVVVCGMPKPWKFPSLDSSVAWKGSSGPIRELISLFT